MVAAGPQKTDEDTLLPAPRSGAKVRRKKEEEEKVKRGASRRVAAAKVTLLAEEEHPTAVRRYCLRCYVALWRSASLRDVFLDELRFSGFENSLFDG